MEEGAGRDEGRREVGGSIAAHRARRWPTGLFVSEERGQRKFLEVVHTSSSALTVQAYLTNETRHIQPGNAAWAGRGRASLGKGFETGAGGEREHTHARVDACARFF